MRRVGKQAVILINPSWPGLTRLDPAIQRFSLATLTRTDWMAAFMAGSNPAIRAAMTYGARRGMLRLFLILAFLLYEGRAAAAAQGGRLSPIRGRINPYESLE